METPQLAAPTGTAGHSHRTRTAATTKRLWARLRPDLRAALTMLIIIAALRTVGLVTGGFGAVFTSPFLNIAYIFQGVLVSRMLLRDQRLQDQEMRPEAGREAPAWRVAALSAIWTQVIYLLIACVIVAVLTGISFGVALVAVPLTVPLLVGDLFWSFLSHVALCSISASLHRRFGGTKLVVAFGLLFFASVVLSFIAVFLSLTALVALGVAIFG